MIEFISEIIWNWSGVFFGIFLITDSVSWKERGLVRFSVFSCVNFDRFYFFILFIYLFLKFIYYLSLAVLGPHLCARALPSCGEWGPLLIAMRGPPTIAASLAAEHRLQTRRLSNCGSRAQSLRGMWDPPRPGPGPASPALAGRLPTTAPPGKPRFYFFKKCVHFM